MQMNPLTMMQMFNQIKGSNNPMGMMQQMFGNNPMFGRAMEMAQGKSPEQLTLNVAQVVRYIIYTRLHKPKAINFL